jgi:hypothetical protein
MLLSSEDEAVTMELQPKVAATELTKREHILLEIVATERTYVTGIESVLDNVARPLQEVIGTNQEIVSKSVSSLLSQPNASHCLDGFPTYKPK